MDVSRSGRRVGLAIGLCLAMALDVSAQAPGSVAGSIVRQDGSPLAGVMVLVQETGDIQWASADGRYVFPRLAPGPYTLLLSLGGYSLTETITVASGVATRLETRVDWPLTFVETLIVTTASRQVESLADAPAAVTTLEAADIARQSASAQLPLLLAAAPGVQVAQSGLYDFNVNARGFNDLVSRNVRTEIDGRQASMPQVMGYTDWASLAFGLDEVERIEFLSGPGGALYGVGALSGVLSVMTKAPADSPGGRARMTVGELHTTRFEARHAASLGGGWFFKALGGYQRSGDFARSRNTSVEYAPGSLATEAVPLMSDRASLAFGSVRLDRQLAHGGRLAFEGGTVSKEGQVSVTGLGRYQATDSSFPWVRAAYESSSWTVRSAFTSVDIDNQVGLASGEGTFQAAYNLEIEAHTNRTFAGGLGRWVGGAAYERQRVDSADPSGVQTNYERPETADGGSVFGQVDYRVTERLKLSFAGRVDASSLSGTTASPRGALVYQLDPRQRVRLAVGRAYKAPTIAGLRLRAPVAQPIDLSALEQALAPLLGGTSLGFGSIPVLAVGNEALEAEAITSVEGGYSALIADRTFLQATYYRNRKNTFTSGLLPQVGTSLGRLNPSFGPYRPPAALSPGAAAAVQQALQAALPPGLLASLSNAADGSPLVAAASFGNFGAASAQGLDLSAMVQVAPRWRLDGSYSWFDFSIDNDAPDVPLLPNTPRHQGAIGVTFVQPRFDIGLRTRFVDGFQWTSGIYSGFVPAYGVADLHTNYRLTPRLALGVDIANLLNNHHYEMFGGDVLRRRALAHVTAGW